MDSIVHLVKGLTANAKGKADGIIANAKNEITSKVAELESSISGLITKGGVIASCAQKNLGDLTEFKNTFGKNVESCAGNLGSAITDFETDVLGEVTSLKSAVSELVNIVDECSADTLQAVVCAVTKVKQVETLVESIVSDAKTAIETARSKANVTVGQIQTCAQQTVGEATVTVNKFVSAVKQCA